MRLIDLSYPQVIAERYGISVRAATRLREKHPNGLPEDALKIFLAERRWLKERKAAKATPIGNPGISRLGMYSRVPGTIRKK